MNEAVLADRVIVMKSGEIYEQGDPKDVFCNVERLWEAGLEVPQTTELIFKLNKKFGWEIPLGVYDFDTCARLVTEKIKEVRGENVGN